MKPNSWQTALNEIFDEATQVKQRAFKDSALLETVAAVAQSLEKVVKSGGTIYACGNGGSTCDAMHLCEELVARFKRERPGIKAMHFMDPSTMTCWSNDYDFSTVFERQAQTFCGPNDMLVGFSTSGNSKNVVAAMKAAKAQKSVTVAFTGKTGGALKSIADHTICVPSEATERIQEVHITMVHALIEVLERNIFSTTR